ncbi:response regulator transcription factor [Alicyclobacillus kakegawensis]|uniref:response regulator transcription factor n=1 Tax=Alicyclobacillus kakegawensis TaxID=392012 RepID=UPI000AD2781B|nr:response regulator transcription factor [Alicyclobacillus kakegawensis]
MTRQEDGLPQGHHVESAPARGERAQPLPGEERASPSAGARIFLVEDDDKLAALIMRRLAGYGYCVRQAADFNRVAGEAAAFQPHLVILDVNLPRYDGFHWCRELRRFSRVPILFLSARTGDMDKVLALEQGADDYLTKPFHPDVLTAKVKALLRRAYGDYAQAAETQAALVWGGFVLDVRRSVLALGGERVTLSNTEREILRLLLQRQGDIVTREELLEAVWDEADFVEDNTLTVNIARIRVKLAAAGAPRVLETVRGVGYRLRPLAEGVAE